MYRLTRVHLRNLRNPLARALLAAAGLVLVLLLAAACAHASGYGELKRFGGEGTDSKDKGSPFELAGEGTHASAADPETGAVYVGDETAADPKDLRVQAYSASGAFEAKGTIRHPETKPAGIGHIAGYEGFAVAAAEKRIYALAVYERSAADKLDGAMAAAGALYALNSTPSSGRLEPAAGTGGQGLLGTTTALGAGSEEQGKALLEPSGITVDPLTGEVLILGVVDTGAGTLHPAVMHVSSTGSVQFTWVDPATTTLQKEPSSPAVSSGGELFFEAGDELLALPASAHGGAPEVVFSFAEPEGFQTGPFANELISFGEVESENAFGGSGLSAVAEGSASEGRLVTLAEIGSMSETGEVEEEPYGVLSLHYSESGGHTQVSEIGWTGGVTGEGPPATPCELGFGGGGVPSVAAVSGGGIDVFAPAFPEVIELGPAGSGCPPAKEAPGGLEATIDGKRVSEVETGDAVTLTGGIVQGNVLSVEWVFAGHKEAPVTTPLGEQTQTLQTTHTFTKPGRPTVEAIVRTDDLSTPELRLKTTLEVVEPGSEPPAVTLSPENESLVEGETAKFKAAATGEPPPEVQWEVSTDGGASWSPLNGQTENELLLANVSAAQNEYQYRATFTNGVGEPVHSAAATLAVETIVAHEAKVHAEELKKKQQKEEEEKKQEELKKQQQEQSKGGSQGSSQTGQSGSQSPPGGAEVAAFKEAAARVTLASTSLPVSAAGALTLHVRCPSEVSVCTGTVTLHISTTVSAGHGKHSAKKRVLTLATGSFSVHGGQAGIVKLHLSAAARSLLAHAHSLRAAASIVAHNAANDEQSLLTTVTLRLTRAR